MITPDNERHLLCTKRKTASRFWCHKEQLHLTMMLPCGGDLWFLGEDWLAALYQLALGRAKYDPSVDIDRYAIVCPIENVEPDACPAWNAIREMLAEGMGNTDGNGAGNVSSGSEQNLIKAKGYGTFVCDSDGTAGPIASRYYPETDAAKAVKEAAKKCSRGTERGDNAADENDVVFHAGIISKFIAWLKGE